MIRAAYPKEYSHGVRGMLVARAEQIFSRAARWGRSHDRGMRSAGLSLEQLEERRLLTTIVPTAFTETVPPAPFSPFAATATATVNVPALRDAILEANFLKGTNTVSLQDGNYI